MHPIIGMTPSLSADGRLNIQENYGKAIATAGGIPLVLCYTKRDMEIIPFLDGLLLSGGGDLNPLLCHQEPIEKIGEINPQRDHWELEICKKARTLGIPILGICRGAQILNVSCGGTVFQDTGSFRKNIFRHSQNAPKDCPTHSVRLRKKSRLFHLLQQRCIPVNSFHHQSIHKAGKGLQICAVSKDGVVEAVENRRGTFLLGLQWHPEWLRAKFPLQQKIFNAFVFEAKKRRNPMEFAVGDIVQMKKLHPCGGANWEVLRTGMDFRLKCCSCGRLILIPREKFEKGVKKIISSQDNQD